MEADAAGVAAIRRVDPAPRPGPLGDARLEVVDAPPRRHAAEAAERLVVGVVPGELVHPLAPDDDLLAAVREGHDEGVEGLRPPADVDARQLAPVGPGLGARG